MNIAVGNIILVCAGAIPGYWVTVALCDTIGRKPIQIMGFVLLTILFCIMGFGYYAIGTSGLFACFVLAQFFFNFGLFLRPHAVTIITDIIAPRNKVPTPPPSLFPASASQQDTGPRATASPLHQVKSVQSLLSVLSARFEQEVPQKTTARHGSTTSWRSSRSSCSAVSSLPFSSLRLSARR